MNIKIRHIQILANSLIVNRVKSFKWGDFSNKHNYRCQNIPIYLNLIVVKHSSLQRVHVKLSMIFILRHVNYILCIPVYHNQFNLHHEAKC